MNEHSPKTALYVFFNVAYAVELKIKRVIQILLANSDFLTELFRCSLPGEWQICLWSKVYYFAMTVKFRMNLKQP